MKNQEFASVIPDGFNAFCQHVPNDTFIVVRQGAIKQFKLPITSEDDSPVDDGGTENNHVPVKGDYLVFVNEEDVEFTRQIGNVYPSGEKHVYVDLLPYNTIQDPPHRVQEEMITGIDLFKDVDPEMLKLCRAKVKEGLVGTSDEDVEMLKEVLGNINNGIPKEKTDFVVDTLKRLQEEVEKDKIEAEKKEGEDYKDLGPDGKLVSTPMNTTPEEAKALKETFKTETMSPEEMAALGIEVIPPEEVKKKKRAPRKSTKKAKKNG